MGKITQEQRNRYFEKVQEHRHTIEAGLAKEKTLLDLVAKDETGVGYKRLHLAEEVLDLSSWHLLINALSVSLLGIKNEEYLIEGRKVLVRALKYLEDTVPAYIDAPFSDYEKSLDEIKDFDVASRNRLFRKFGYAIQAYEEAFGDNSKYSMSFIELWGKYTALAKNFVDLRTVMGDLDFNSPVRPVIAAHLALVKSLCQRCADRYREKYELYTTKPVDFRQAILFLSALRRLNIALGDREEAETLKRKIDVWNSKLDADEKKIEEARK
jgi:hypothetical protein